MAFDKNEIKQLESMFEKNNKIITEQVVDQVVDHVLEGVEALIDNKIEDAKSEIEERAQKRHSVVMDTLDSFIGEKKTSEQERIVQSEQISRNTKRIEKLETRVFN